MAIRSFGGGGGGTSAEYVAIAGTERGAVVAFTGDSSATDLVGDSTLDQDDVVYASAAHVTGLADTFDTSTTQLLGTTGDTAHKVAIDTPLTIAMMYKSSEIESTGYLFASSTTTSSFNYGLAHVSGLFSVRFGAHTSTGIPFIQGAWTHICLTSPADRLSFKFYVNGELAFSSGAVTAGAVGGGDSLKIGNVGAANGDVTGHFSDILVANVEYDSGEVRTLSNNAFGSSTTACPGVSHVAITGDEPSFLFGWTGDNTATDIGANEFILDVDTPVYAQGTHYSGSGAAVFSTSTTQLLATTEGASSGAAFQVPVATDITFGGMFFTDVAESTPYYIANGTTFTNVSYALVGQSGYIKYQTSAAIVDTGVKLPFGAWHHLCAVSSVNRTLTKVYLNGAQIGGDLVTTATTPSSSSELYIGNIGAANGDRTGWASDIFLADTAYTDQQVRTAAENAFGHVLP
jgi:hypothetical protein